MRTLSCSLANVDANNTCWIKQHFCWHFHALLEVKYDRKGIEKDKGRHVAKGQGQIRTQDTAVRPQPTWHVHLSGEIPGAIMLKFNLPNSTS